MATLKYTVIEAASQYKEYCNTLEKLVCKVDKTEDDEKEIKLLTLLIEKWDEEHNGYNELDPIELLVYLMEENNLKQKDLAGILGVSKSVISEILSHKKGLSKDKIRKLADHFKISQELFNKKLETA